MLRRPRLNVPVSLAVVAGGLALVGLTAAPAAAAPLGLEPGDVVVSDSGNGRVLVIPADDGPDRVLADGLASPGPVAVTPEGDVVVGEVGTGSILRIPADGAPIVDLNAYPPYTSIAGLSTLALDGEGNVLFGGGGWGGIGRVPLQGGLVELHIYPSPARTYPGIAVAPDGDIVAAEYPTPSGQAVVRMDADGANRVTIPELTYDSAAPADSTPRNPESVEVTTDGRALVAESWTDKIWESDGSGGVTSFGTGLNNPTSLALDDATGVLYAADAANHRIVRFSANRATQTAIATDLAEPLLHPSGVAVVPVPPTEVGDVFLAADGDVFELHPDGSGTQIAGGFGAIGGLAVDGDGDLLVAAGGSIVEVAGDGSGRRTTIASGLNTLTGVAVGPDDQVYASVDVDGMDGSIYRVRPGLTQVHGGDVVHAVTVGPDGTVYFAQPDAVRRVALAGGTVVSEPDPGAVAWHPGSRLLYDGPAHVRQVDPTTGVAADRFGVTPGPTELAVGAEGEIYYASGTTIGQVADGSTTLTDLATVAAPAGLATYVPTPELTAATPPTAGNVGEPYDGYEFEATDPGGLGVEFTLYDGTLPPGLTLDPDTGELSGEPTASGDRTFRIQAANPGRAIVSDPITISIGKRLQEITFEPATGWYYRGDTYTPVVDGGDSTSDVVLSIDPSSTSMCSYDSSTGAVTFLAAGGSCVILADQAGDADYEAAPQASQIVYVDKRMQTTTFSTSAPSAPEVGGTYSAAGTSDSGLPVEIRIHFSTSGNCSVDGAGVVTFEQVGLCRVQAWQAGDDDYWSDGDIQTLNVAAATFRFTSSPPAPALLGTTYTPTTNAPSAIFDLDPSSGAGVCTVDVGTGVVTFLAPGSCVVTADNLGDPNYSSSVATQTIAVGRRTSSTTITSIPPSPAVVGQQYRVTADASPAGAVIVGTTGTTCSIQNGVVTFLHAGTCEIRASRSADPTHGASEAVQTVQVLPASTATSVALVDGRVEARVTVVQPGGGTPTGSVVFTADGVEIGTAPLGADGVASVPDVARSSDSVSATYLGSGDHLGSAGSVARSRTNPTITATVTSRRPVSEFGWYRTPVKITFECTVGSAPLVGGCIGPVRLTENRRGVNPISAAITAEDGGTARVDVAGIRIDRTDPSLTVRGAKNGRTYESKRELRCVARDRLSGVDRCKLRQKVRGDVVRFRAVAFDKAGNRTVVRGRYFLD